MDNLYQLIPWLFGVLILIVTSWSVVRWLKHLASEAGRAPVDEKMLRSPGESLRCKIEQIDDDFIPTLFAMVGSAVLCGPALIGTIKLIVVASGYSANDWKSSKLWSNPIGPDFILFPLLTVLIVLVFIQKTKAFINLVMERRNHNLGYRGERVVGEELNKLMKDGCEVFHDFKIEDDWNIDHIIVAPGGVFVVETKTRRKKKGPPGTKDHEVIFDGKSLIFPHCVDQFGLDQAKNNARSLSQFLGKATGKPVFVFPILVFPGWWVTSKVNSTDIKVLNPKGVRSFVTNQPDRLPADHFKQIVFQIDKQCRDVEF